MANKIVTYIQMRYGLFLLTFALSTSVVGQPIWTAEELGHQGRINVVEFSPDGIQLASGAEDYNILLRDADTGQELQHFTGHSGPILTLAFSSDGTRLVSGSSDQSIRIWDIESGRELQLLTAHTGPVYSVDFSPSGKQLISGSEDKSILLWDTETGQELQQFTGHTGSVHSVVFLPNGTQFISGSEDESIRLWEIETGRQLQSFLKHTGPVYSVDYSPNGDVVFSGSGDKSTILWRLANGEEILSRNHEDEVISVKFSMDGTLLAAGLRNEYIKLIKLPETQTTTLETPYNHLSSIALSPDNMHLAFGTERIISSGLKFGSIYLWDFASQPTSSGPVELRNFIAHTHQINSVMFSPDGSQLVTASWDGSVRFWDIASGKVLRNIKYLSSTYSLSFSPDGSQLAIGLLRGNVVLLEAATGTELRRLPGRENDERSFVIFSPDGSQLATSSHTSGTIRLWDLSTDEEPQLISGHTGGVTSMVFSPDGSQLISGSHDRSIRLWDVETGQELRRFSGHAESVHSIAISSDGSQLASGSIDGSVRIWDVGTGEELQVILGHFAPVRFVIFSPDGAQVASGGSDRYVRRWDVSTGKDLGTLEHGNFVLALDISRDSKFLASAGGQTLKLWDWDPTVLGFSQTIPDLSYPLSQPITPLALPEAVGGVKPIEYTITPTLPEGLKFDASTRTISGTPTAVAASEYKYTATDANGMSKNLLFKIFVYSTVSIDSQSLPESFTVVGNYPNPFQKSTQLTFDLPWPARVQVELMDVIGRRVMTIPERNVAAGWARTIDLSGEALPAGVYLYRLIANSSSGNSVQMGQIVRIR